VNFTHLQRKQRRDHSFSARAAKMDLLTTGVRIRHTAAVELYSPPKETKKRPQLLTAT
jgi:hypothetical protein